MVIDTAETVLLFVLVILTILILILGVQVFLILKDLRRTVGKANKVLDDTGVITDAVSRPAASFSSITTGIKAGAAIAKLFTKKSKRDKSGSTQSNKEEDE